MWCGSLVLSEGVINYTFPGSNSKEYLTLNEAKWVNLNIKMVAILE